MKWSECKKILCVRPDNMGDLLMSAPAIAAVKETFKCSVSLLTSSMAAGIAEYIPGIDEVITWDVPWVKGTEASSSKSFEGIVGTLAEKKFDGAIIFTVFSQNPLPTALMLTLAGIENRVAYCRENPYHLLSHWLPEKEPYTFIRHQVRRDLDLVRAIGGRTSDERITIRLPGNLEHVIRKKLFDAGVDAQKPWLIMHPGVSEEKRKYPEPRWVDAGRKIVSDLGYQVLVTGSQSESALAHNIAAGIGEDAFTMAGSLSLPEFLTLIRFSPLLISVNTASVHLASAVHTKVIVLYALTNPQHPPWRSVGKILPFSVPEHLQSRNEVLCYVQRHYFSGKIVDVTPDEIVRAAQDILVNGNEALVEELVTSTSDDKVHLRNQQNFVFP